MAQFPRLEDFVGAWHLSRVIQDHLTDTKGTLTGEARFAEREPGVLDYIESKSLSLGAQPPLEATRRYIWEQDEGRIFVRFEDGRDFHEIRGDRLLPDAEHFCDPDLYHVSYDFTRWSAKRPKWRAMWRVKGPRKDYRMISDYTRSA
ncbi:MAG: DUF6314 family protein [Litoreibacter sp.]|nr:DUF6314 family protein [Litoreibacter sp.]